jgi:hypothetical protein
MTGAEVVMDYSPFYYTYSTISQTLASAFGFLGAVMLYQLQQLNNESERLYEQGIRLVRVEEKETCFGARGFILAEMDDLKAALTKPLNWTAGSIFASLILMPLTSKSTPLGSPWLAWPSLALTVASAIYTFTTYRPLVIGLQPSGHGKAHWTAEDAEAAKRKRAAEQPGSGASNQ